ncbi:hypothetical protein F6X40_28695 [Paraburkholderia sp. UCT31]|uniref:hypothetical protein n=1 Tax=Paraburkholderia sp. UCT31 TaxID=2615209 RepID=UPI0016555BFD|nr:hypothetical protein [Paraburkholderia sp. UCT31]MBC8740613.1 hypothetical protein [Paraburkholderia sp. UCT31]
MTKAAEKVTDAKDPLTLGAAHIRQLREARAKLTSEVPRLAALVEAADGHSGEIQSLQRARTEAQALALIDSHEADTASIDAGIAEAEHAAAKALEDGLTAHAALDVIAQRRAALDADLNQAVEAQLETAARDLIARREATYTEFNTAVNALRAPLERMLAFELSLIEVRRRQSKASGSGIGPAHNLVAALQDQGLRVLREHDHAVWPVAWLSWPELTSTSPAFRRDFFHDAGLD